MTFAERFDALPAAERAEALRLLHKALLYRGGSGLGAASMQAALVAVAEVFYRNGTEIEEYT